MLAPGLLQGTAPRPPETHPLPPPPPSASCFEDLTQLSRPSLGRAPPDTGAENQGNSSSVWIHEAPLSWGQVCPPSSCAQAGSFSVRSTILNLYLRADGFKVKPSHGLVGSELGGQIPERPALPGNLLESVIQIDSLEAVSFRSFRIRSLPPGLPAGGALGLRHAHRMEDPPGSGAMGLGRGAGGGCLQRMGRLVGVRVEGSSP